MSGKKKAVVLLVPGFASNEEDTTCIPPLQQFCLAFTRLRPDIELRVISFQYPYKKGHYLWNDIQVYSAGGRGYKYNRLLTWFSVWVQLSKIRKENDLCIIHSFWMTECTLVGQWYSLRYKIKHIAYVVGQDALKTNRYLRLINFSKIKIVAMSESLINHFFRSTQFKIAHLIPSGIDRNKIPLIDEERTIDILGVGTLTPLKNYLLFIELIVELKKSLPGIKARIIGRGEQEQLLRKSIQNSGIGNNLELLGEVPHESVFAYMQQSKIFLHTSSYEGQSTVIAEALANGLTVVCFDVGRTHVKDKIWVCADKQNMLNKLKELLALSLSYEPVITATTDDMVNSFFKLYAIN